MIKISIIEYLNQTNGENINTEKYSNKLRSFIYPNLTFVYLPYTKTLLFNNLKIAYAYAFYNIEGVSGKFYFDNDKLINEFFCDFVEDDYNEDEDDFDFDGEVSGYHKKECKEQPYNIEENVSDKIVTGWLKDVPYYNELSKDEIWGYNIIKKCTLDFDIEYTNYETVCEKIIKGHTRIVLWASNQYDGLTSKVCFLTL